jgi:predicted Zn-dependent peptidase
VGVYIACSPDKREEAIQGIRATLEKVHRSGLTPSALRRAKEYLLGRRAMDLQGDLNIASHYGIGLFYGVKPQDETKIIQKIKNLTASDLRRVLERYYLKPHLVTAIVG